MLTRKRVQVMRDLHEAMVDVAAVWPDKQAYAEWLRMSRPRRTKLKGHPMTGANAIVSRPPVPVASREKPI